MSCGMMMRVLCWQEPALWVLDGPAVVTRFGAILSNGNDLILDPEEHGVCHRMRSSEDLSPRNVTNANAESQLLSPPAGERAPAESLVPGAVEELFVISQPWGHTVFHFVAECLPKVSAHNSTYHIPGGQFACPAPYG
jgi:hypothetical protein